MNELWRKSQLLVLLYGDSVALPIGGKEMDAENWPGQRELDLSSSPFTQLSG